MRTRFACLFAVAALIATADAGAVTPGRLEFDVLRNGVPFGTHKVAVSESGGEVRVESEAVLRAGLGPVTLFHYEQACAENWRAGVLVGLSCSTLNEGRRVRVSARQVGQELRVLGPEGETAFALGALPTSWWIKPPASVRSLIDTESGQAMALEVSHLGREMMEVGGVRIEAERVRVRGTLTVDLWYDEAGRWVGCAFTTRGQRIEYRLRTPRSAAPAA